jgi:hypothetical protein
MVVIADGVAPAGRAAAPALALADPATARPATARPALTAQAKILVLGMVSLSSACQWELSSCRR